MAYDYLFSFAAAVPSGGIGPAFTYVSPYDVSGWDEDELSYRIPSGATSGADGEYQSDSYYEPRSLRLRGTLIAQDGNPTTLQGYLDTLFAAHPKGGRGQLFRHSGRYINCRVSSILRPAETLDAVLSAEWAIRFRADDPLYYDATYQTAVALPQAGGATSVTVGGSGSALPVVTLNVTAPGTIQLTESGRARSLTFTANVAGTWVIDCENLQITSTGGGAIAGVGAFVSGSWLELQNATLAPASTVTLTLSGGATLGATGNQVQWKRRWVTA